MNVALTQPTGNAAEAAQDMLDRAVKQAERAMNGYRRGAAARRYLAYGLKGIALFGGLAIAVAPGLKIDLNMAAAGATISAAVILDQWLSNHKRMMMNTMAATAIAQTIRRISNDYNDRIIPVVKASSENGKAAIASDMLIELAASSARVLRSELDTIQRAVEAANIELLGSLNIDKATPAALPPPSTPAQP